MQIVDFLMLRLICKFENPAVSFYQDDSKFLFQGFKNLTFAEVAQLCKNDTTKLANDFIYYMDKAKVGM